MSAPIKPEKKDTVYTGKGGKPHRLPDLEVTHNRKTGKTTSKLKKPRSVKEAIDSLRANPKFK